MAYNYETKTVEDQFSNDPGWHDYWSNRAQELWAETEPREFLNKSQAARYDLADLMKDQLNEDFEQIQPIAEPFQSLITGALSDVDWDEIADTYLCDCDGYERKPEDSRAN